jgi:uncharacterized spore protein YtfJ
MSTFEEMLADARDIMTVKKVFGEPYQSNGVTVIPAASIRGGLGGGEGEGSDSTPAGRGGGMGISARPIGAYQIKGDQVAWIPAIDLTRIILTGQIVVVTALLVVRSVLRRRRRS